MVSASSDARHQENCGRQRRDAERAHARLHGTVADIQMPVEKRGRRIAAGNEAAAFASHPVYGNRMRVAPPCSTVTFLPHLIKITLTPELDGIDSSKIYDVFRLAKLKPLDYAMSILY
jgi:hypothetical protein